jgi:hypothetical protein
MAEKHSAGTFTFISIVASRLTPDPTWLIVDREQIARQLRFLPSPASAISKPFKFILTSELILFLSKYTNGLIPLEALLLWYYQPNVFKSAGTKC